MKDEDYNHNDKTTSSSPPDDLRGGGDKTDEKNGWVDEDQEYNNNTSDETQVYKVVKLKDIYIYEAAFHAFHNHDNMVDG